MLVYGKDAFGNIQINLNNIKNILKLLNFAIECAFYNDCTFFEKKNLSYYNLSISSHLNGF